MAAPVASDRTLQKRYGLDLRSLALLRMGLALVLLTNLVAQLTTRPAATDLLSAGYWSLHLLSDQAGFQILLFLIAIVSALAMLVGYRSRLATIVSWVLIVSLHNRSPLLLTAGDDVLRAFLFWAMFLPLGAKYSIDSAFNPEAPKLPKQIFGVATLALILQQCYVYLGSAAFKTFSATGWLDGGIDQAVTPLGSWLLNLGVLLPLLSFFTLVLHWVGPLFLLVPIRTDLCRTIAIGVFTVWLLVMGLTLNLGIFPLLGMVTWLAFIPTSVWEGWCKRLYGPEQHGLVLHYDVDCGFCKKVVHLIRTLVLLPETPLRTTQSDPEILAAMELHNSWVVVDWQGQHHYRFEAIAYVCSLSPVFWIFEPLLRWSPVMWAGNRFYEAIANNRRHAGLFTRPFKFKSFSVSTFSVGNVVAAIFLGLLTLGNLLTFIEISNWLKLPVQATWLDQSWQRIPPNP
ncbi:MAG: DCC1-like thiol-disulfide oxidoreductase family protein [Cyanobacteria bacterium J06642_11]